MSVVVKEEGSWEVFKVRFDGFETLPRGQGQSPSFTCFGHQWKLTFYPHGMDEYDSSWVQVFLYHDNYAASIEVDANLFVKDSTMKVVAFSRLAGYNYQGNSSRGVNLPNVRLSLVLSREGRWLLRCR